MQVPVHSDGKLKYGKYKYLFAELTMQLPSTISKTSHKERNIKNIQYVSFLIMKVDR